MSERIPPVPKEQLSPDQQAFHAHFIDSVNRNSPHPGAADRASKTLFPVLAVLPTVGRHNIDFFADLESSTKDFLSKDVTEVVSLVATTYFRSAFITHVHKVMDVRMGILSRAQADSITAGEKPEDLSERCALAYDAAWQLVAVRGPFPQEMWERCVGEFGVEGTVGIMHFVGLLSWTSLGLNMANVPVPTGPPSA